MFAQRPKPHAPHWNWRLIAERVILYAILIGIAVIVVVPILWMLSTSFKPKSQWFLPDIYWIPKTFTWDNYTSILNNPSLPMARWFFNSIGRD